MKRDRHLKIKELIKKYNIETQEELAERLQAAGFEVTQATVSRDIRQLKLSKVPAPNGKQCYAVTAPDGEYLADIYVSFFKVGLVSMDMAQNILVIKTVSGMAMAVAAALDAMKFHEIVGCIAGDDTIMCAVRSVEETVVLMDKIGELI